MNELGGTIMLGAEWLVLAKLGASVILGLIIGLEREIRRKPLGLKTSLVICVSSCLLTIVSIESANRFAVPTVHVMDPMRLAAQIVSGVGFLGAGVILRKNNDVIMGLTTAAMIWSASGLGIAVGAGFFLEAFIGVSLIIISVELFPIILKNIGPKSLSEKEIKLDLIIKKEDNKIIEIMDAIKAKGIKIKTVRIRDLLLEPEKGSHRVFLTITVNEKRYTADVYHEIKQIKNIVSVEIENL
jgi:putative Mg2+ transporter-C (MgtC) family protein